MKINYFLLPLIAILFSCKKGRICDCNTTWTFQLNSGGYDTRIFPSTSTYSTALTKKQGISSCEHESAVVQSSFEDLITEHGQYPLKTGEKIETTCILH